MNFNEGSKGNFEKSEVGAFAGRLFRLIDLGTQTSNFNGDVKEARKVQFIFEMPDNVMKGEFKPELAGKPFCAQQIFTQSLHEKASLRKFLVSWRGKDFSDEERMNFDPKKLLGKTALLNLVQSKDGAFINIGSISPLPKGMECKPPVNPVIYFSLNEFSRETFEKLSDKTKDKIKSSPEWTKYGLDTVSADPVDHSTGEEIPF
jgi:hypothetical protein